MTIRCFIFFCMLVSAFTNAFADTVTEVAEKPTCVEPTSTSTVKENIANALCWAKRDYYRKATSILAKVILPKDAGVDTSDKLTLTKLIVDYHRYHYYKEHKPSEAKGIAADIYKATEEFAKSCNTESLTRLALSMQAKVAFSEEQYQLAGEIWTSVLHKNPPDNLFHESMVGIVRSENALGRHPQVIQSVKQFLTRYAPTLTVARRQSLTDELVKTSIEYAQLLAKQGKTEDAAGVLKHMSATFPSSGGLPQILLQQAFYFGSALQWDKAIATCDAILTQQNASHDEKASAAYLKAKAFEHKLDLQKAADELLSFAKAYPKHERALAASDKAAQLFMAEGHFKKAAVALLLAATLDKESSSLYYLKAGESLMIEGDVAKAKTILPHIKSVNFDNELQARVHLLSGQVTLKTSGIETAASELEKVAGLAKALDPSLSKLGATASMLLADAYLPEFDRIKVEGSIDLVRSRFAEKADLYEGIISKYLQNVISSKVPGLRVTAAQKLAKISLNFQQEIDYAANFITADMGLRQSMKQYTQILTKVTPLYLKEQHALEIRLPVVAPSKQKEKESATKPKYKKIEFFQDNSLGSF